jgi:PAS domain S-box-containing protein
VSDGLIWFSYMAIPVLLIWFVRRRKDVPFPRIFWMFGAFIVLCGLTHLVEMVMSVQPMYRLSGVVKLATAGVSLATFVALRPLIPVALALRSPKELEEVNEQLGREVSERKKAEDELGRKDAELMEREGFARSLMQAVSDAIVTADDRGNIVSWNKGAQEIFGYTAEEAGGKPLSSLLPERHRENHGGGGLGVGASAGSRAPGKALELEGLRRSGTEFPMELRLDAWETGGKRFFTGIIRDTTERRFSEERFRVLMESAPDAMVIAEKDGRIALVNAQTERLFGYHRAELVGQPVELLVPERFRARHPGHRQDYVQSPKFRAMGSGLELFGRRKDGSEFPVEISLSPLVTKQGTYVASAIRDVTDRKEAEERIRTLNSSLEERVRELEVLNKEMESFSYSVSHDLRAPLRAVDGFSKMLLEAGGSHLDEPGRRLLERVRAASQRMGGLIDALLNLSRVTRLEMRPENVDLTELAHSIAEELKKSDPGRSLTFTIAPRMQATGDPQLLKLVLENLMGNASKFTGKRPDARVEVGLDRKDGKRAYFVRDNGAGFDMSYADKLFGPFQRLHDSEEFEGTGIGLATVARIVHRHGGQVWAEGAVGQGAVFWFSLGS